MATAASVQVIDPALSEVADTVVGVSASRSSGDRRQASSAAATCVVERSDLAYERGITADVNALDAQPAVLTEFARLGKAPGSGWNAAPNRRTRGRPPGAVPLPPPPAPDRWGTARSSRRVGESRSGPDDMRAARRGALYRGPRRPPP